MQDHDDSFDSGFAFKHQSEHHDRIQTAYIELCNVFDEYLFVDVISDNELNQSSCAEMKLNRWL